MLIVQIVISCIILIVWSVRLVKKGNKLVEDDKERKSQKSKNETDFEPSNRNPLIDDQLFQLAKNYHGAKLDHDFGRMNQTKEDLVNHLGLEYRKTSKKFSRLLMFKRIRLTLIQNPYDQVGRRMAADTKDIFKQCILKEFPF